MKIVPKAVSAVLNLPAVAAEIDHFILPTDQHEPRCSREATRHQP